MLYFLSKIDVLVHLSSIDKIFQSDGMQIRVNHAIELCPHRKCFTGIFLRAEILLFFQTMHYRRRTFRQINDISGGIFGRRLNQLIAAAFAADSLYRSCRLD